MVIRLMNDYGADWPLWEDGLLPQGAPAVPPELERRRAEPGRLWHRAFVPASLPTRWRMFCPRFSTLRANVQSAGRQPRGSAAQPP